MKSTIRTICGVLAVVFTLLLGGLGIASVIANLSNPEMYQHGPEHALVGSVLAACCCMGVPWVIVMFMLFMVFMCVKE